MRKNINILKFALIFLVFTFVPVSNAEMTKYCATPPFISSVIPPNVLIILDNSGSMNNKAYDSGYDPSQFMSGHYYGYFEPDKNYQYVDSGRWVVTSLPLNSGTVNNPIAKGDFLNWATMRRIDIAKKILIGGKADPRSPQGSVTVKLHGENSSTDWNFSHSFDNTNISGLIYPFVGEYKYSMKGNELYITKLTYGSNTEDVKPNGDIYIPSTTWSINGAGSAWEALSDEDDNTYIENSNGKYNNYAILNYSYTPSISGTITSISIKARAKKIKGKKTLRMKGVLKINDTYYDSNNSVKLRKTYKNYTFDFDKNPATGENWKWSDFKDNASYVLDGFGIRTIYNNSTHYSKISKIYLEITVSTPNGGPYTIIVDQGMKKAQGIIDSLSDDVRFGLSYYNNGCGIECGYSSGRNDGGHIENYVDFGSKTDMITSISNMSPSTWTPLAETLYEDVRYFRQESPYYNNSPSDYAVSQKNDPYYYQFSKLKGSSRSDQYVYCAKSFVLLMTDGESTEDQNIPNLLRDYDKDGNDPGSYCCSGTDYLDDVALWARTTDQRSDLKGMQNIYLYTVFMFGNGSDLLKDASINGGFNDFNGDGKPGPSIYEYMRDSNGDGVVDNSSDLPLTYYEGNDGYSLEQSIKQAITDILKRSSSGTAASILATNEKSGSVILQALFYPKKTFDNNTDINWAGSLKNMWFYLGPFVQNIREDTDEDKELNLLDDYAISFYFDNSTNTTMVHVMKDSNGDGIPDTSLPDKKVSDVKYLWDAGLGLWETGPNDRKIFTDLDNLTNDSLKGNFIDSNTSLLQNYLDADNATQAENIINYIRGNDIAGYRNRTVTIGSDSHVWKLGDIIYSTPKVVSGTPLNAYNKRSPYGYSDSTYRKFIESDIYKNRGMVFVGANDGMLHAFRLGKITMLNTGGSDIAELEEQPATTELGSEAWGFIPKNLLPYLKYYMDKDYCHLYYVDLTPYVFDASIEAPNEHTSDYFDQTKTEDSWRTILVGGLNFGGACGDNVTGAINPPNSTKKVPSGIGRSSYFALDVTDPENPTVLWEFSDNDTAFTTTGPAIVHIPAKKLLDNGTYVDDTSKNGYWYAVFASGPDNSTGTVHQPLYLYVLDLKTGQLKRKIQLSGSSCTLSGNNCQNNLIGDYNAFAGRMFESSADLGENYSDDAVYFGYTYEGNSWDGGILRLFTNDDEDASNWTVSKLIDGIGPVTSSVRTLEDKNNHNLWVYFGEGRYFTKEDDDSAQRRIYGVEDPCYNSGSYTSGCTTTLSLSDLTDVTNDANASISKDGWYINLNSPGGSYNAERMITDPVASTNGWVFYTTFMPTNDICGFGGDSYVWMVNYNNGGTPQNVEGSLYIQLSTGAIQKIDLTQQLGAGHGSYGGRKLSSPLVGVPPPSAGMTLILPPPPINKVIQWEEK